MDYVVKKTSDLTEEEKQLLLDCFIEVFEQNRSLEEMMNQYINTPMGYCVHSLCFDNNQIVASHTAFPSYYWVGEKKVKVYITGDTMVRRGYRDGFVFMDIVRGLKKYMKNNGYSFSFGFPNEKSYPVLKKAKFSKDIGRLDTYFLPYRIGGIKKGLCWLNPVSEIFCRLWLCVTSINSRNEVYPPLIHKDDETYNVSRYKRMTGDYSHVDNEITEFYYKIKIHEGIRTAFLIDVVNKTESSIHNAVSYILRHEKNNFDLLLFVGHLPLRLKKTGLLKMPRKYEPKHFYMTGAVYDNSIVNDDLFYNINNWDVNLSDYDLI